MKIMDSSISFNLSVELKLLEDFVQPLEPELYVPVQHHDHMLISLEP